MKTAILAFLAATAIYASPVTIHMIDTGAGLSDGTFFVGPYDITIDGNPYKALCYDVLDESNVGDVWSAQSLSLTNVMTGGGQFSVQPGSAFKYQEVGYLASLNPSSSASQIDLQHALWSLFAPGAVTITAGVQWYLDNASSHAASYTGHATYLEAPGHQALVVFSPEPATVWFGLIGFGLLLIGRFAIKLSRVGSQSDQRISDLQ